MEFDERRYRPLSTVDLFDEAFDLYKRNFVLFLTIVSFVVVPSTIFSDVFAIKWLNALTAQVATISSSVDGTATALDYLSEFFKQSAIACLLYLPAWTLVSATLTAAVSARYRDEPVSLGRAFIQGVKRWIPALAATILFSVLTSIGFAIIFLSFLAPALAVLFVFVGMFAGLACAVVASSRFPLYMGAVVVENLGPIQALRRSLTLTRSDTGRVVWTILCMFILFVVVSGAAAAVLELFTGKLVDSSYLAIPALANNELVASQIASGLANLLLTPFAIIVMTLIYFDQRIRKEGYDMEVLADRLGYPPVTPSSGDVFAPALTPPLVKRGNK
jgi:hypothetical protein